ncbi:hypothetical protein ACFSKN_08110 [Mariniflexile gromovii]|uniref:Baseplate J-like protein n=1 Tax=Mariniflexile gromovii TaxID=362523 RepID=A0ABS4BUC3_9FLAO|nr:hypothetical protein [Mariniflexile gromovii]MBP0904185.1 hypothetical protein [Mariniflexile gromovii]
MKNTSNISHPLKNRSGLSQKNRLKQALMPDYAPIDGKTLADRLLLISDYARHINFYNTDGTSQEIKNWTPFFKESLPFQLAILSKTSVDDLETQFLLLSNELTTNPSKQTLEALFEFIYNKLIVSTSTLFNTVKNAQNSFSIPLLGTIKSSFVAPLKTFICLYNASVTFLCINKKDFNGFMAKPWQLKVNDIYALDVCIQKVKKGQKEAFLKAAEILNTVFYQILSGFRDIVETADGFIEESLYPLEESLQKKHQPHLALMFTFLELFKHFQGNINELGKNHMDFFYEQVLKMVPKDAVPDMAHIVFEVAKHLDEYPLPKDLLLKDGKDVNKQDIQFGLDHEIILDKAQIKDLRTLSLYPIKDNTGQTFIEGFYIAPIANSLDGKGEKFKKDEPANWKTLGYKYSKLIQDGNDVADEHPKARLGFVLASPVLLLQEGKRSIRILLNCDVAGGDSFVLANIKDKLSEKNQITHTISNNFLDECANALSVAAKNFIAQLLAKQSPYEFNDLEEFLSAKDTISCETIFDERDRKIVGSCIQSSLPVKVPLFDVWFSGEEGWIAATPIITINVPPIAIAEFPASGQVQFELKIDLEADVPAITFYNEEVLEEKIDLKKTLPLVKIELNKALEINHDTNSDIQSECCLIKNELESVNKYISPYNFLKKLKLIDAFIDVKVCGVKKLIVQNDDGKLDINSQIFPFGMRPEVTGFNPMNQVDLLNDEEGSEADTDPFLGPSFYIGSKEVLFKKWKCIRVNLEWKDKPESFNDYYKAYIKKVKDLGSPPNLENFGLDQDAFKLKIDKLNDGKWLNTSSKIELFSKTDEDFCELECDKAIYGWEIENSGTIKYVDYNQSIDNYKNSLNGFLKFTLADQDFLHKEYPFVLARQMLAYAYIDQGKKLTDAIYISESQKTIITPILDFLGIDAIIDEIKEVSEDLITKVNEVLDFIETNETNVIDTVSSVKTNIETIRNTINTDLLGYFDDVINAVLDFAATFNGKRTNIFNSLSSLANGPAQTAITDVANFFSQLLDLFNDTDGVNDLISKVEQVLEDFDKALQLSNIFNFLKGDAFQALIPNEPWTPIIKNLYIDYSANAIKEDIDIIHLYPYENTSKFEDIEQNPTLFPFFDDEGTLFIGIENITPGGTLSILFQLAEATADSEQDRADIHWYYLSNNKWIKLLSDFDVISDETDGFTISGIVTIVVPKAINKIGNTIMPDNLYWIKVTAPKNVSAVAEIIGVHTQAAKTSARFSLLSDKNRLDKPLQAKSIAKLVEADFSVKKVEQLYPSFGGRLPEASGHFYVRVSEHLKHKGRGITISDYEKVVLEGFPEIYKVKCISHTMGLSANVYRRDLEVAPGYSVVAVIPDLTKLQSGNLQEPKAPVSLLEKIADFLKERTSPFARIKVMNPRYEYIDVTIKVRLYRGKSSSFYSKKLKEDIALFLAPWFLGDSEKIVFGQVIYFSDIVGYVEQLDYIDFIDSIKLEGPCEQTGAVIKPLTARSVLTGGDICVTISDEACADCEEPRPQPQPDPEPVIN